MSSKDNSKRKKEDDKASEKRQEVRPWHLIQAPIPPKPPKKLNISGTQGPSETLTLRSHGHLLSPPPEWTQTPEENPIFKKCSPQRARPPELTSTSEIQLSVPMKPPPIFPGISESTSIRTQKSPEKPLTPKDYYHLNPYPGQKSPQTLEKDPDKKSSPQTQRPKDEKASEKRQEVRPWHLIQAPIPPKSPKKQSVIGSIGRPEALTPLGSHGSLNPSPGWAAPQTPEENPIFKKCSPRRARPPELVIPTSEIKVSVSPEPLITFPDIFESTLCTKKSSEIPLTLKKDKYLSDSHPGQESPQTREENPIKSSTKTPEYDKASEKRREVRPWHLIQAPIPPKPPKKKQSAIGTSLSGDKGRSEALTTIGSHGNLLNPSPEWTAPQTPEGNPIFLKCSPRRAKPPELVIPTSEIHVSVSPEPLPTFPGILETASIGAQKSLEIPLTLNKDQYLLGPYPGRKSPRTREDPVVKQSSPQTPRLQEKADPSTKSPVRPSTLPNLKDIFGATLLGAHECSVIPLILDKHEYLLGSYPGWDTPRTPEDAPVFKECSPRKAKPLEPITQVPDFPASAPVRILKRVPPHSTASTSRETKGSPGILTSDAPKQTGPCAESSPQIPEENPIFKKCSPRKPKLPESVTASATSGAEVGKASKPRFAKPKQKFKKQVAIEQTPEGTEFSYSSEKVECSPQESPIVTTETNLPSSGVRPKTRLSCSKEKKPSVLPKLEPLPSTSKQGEPVLSPDSTGENLKSEIFSQQKTKFASLSPIKAKAKMDYSPLSKKSLQLEHRVRDDNIEQSNEKKLKDGASNIKIPGLLKIQIPDEDPTASLKGAPLYKSIDYNRSAEAAKRLYYSQLKFRSHAAETNNPRQQTVRQQPDFTNTAWQENQRPQSDVPPIYVLPRFRYSFPPNWVDPRLQGNFPPNLGDPRLRPNFPPNLGDPRLRPNFPRNLGDPRLRLNFPPNWVDPRLQGNFPPNWVDPKLQGYRMQSWRVYPQSEWERNWGYQRGRGNRLQKWWGNQRPPFNQFQRSPEEQVLQDNWQQNLSGNQGPPHNILHISYWENQGQGDRLREWLESQKPQVGLLQKVPITQEPRDHPPITQEPRPITQEPRRDHPPITQEPRRDHPPITQEPRRDHPRRSAITQEPRRDHPRRSPITHQKGAVQSRNIPESKYLKDSERVTKSEYSEAASDRPEEKLKVSDLDFYSMKNEKRKLKALRGKHRKMMAQNKATLTQWIDRSSSVMDKLGYPGAEAYSELVKKDCHGLLASDLAAEEVQQQDTPCNLDSELSDLAIADTKEQEIGAVGGLTLESSSSCEPLLEGNVKHRETSPASRDYTDFLGKSPHGILDSDLSQDDFRLQEKSHSQTLKSSDSSDTEERKIDSIKGRVLESSSSYESKFEEKVEQEAEGLALEQCKASYSGQNLKSPNVGLKVMERKPCEFHPLLNVEFRGEKLGTGSSIMSQGAGLQTSAVSVQHTPSRVDENISKDDSCITSPGESALALPSNRSSDRRSYSEGSNFGSGAMLHRPQEQRSLPKIPATEKHSPHDLPVPVDNDSPGRKRKHRRQEKK